MARLDLRSYEETVVKPLRRWPGRELPDDLVSRYAIDLTMSDAEVVARLGEIRSHWHKGTQSSGKAASVRSLYKAFLRADEELRGQHGDQLYRIAWWQEHARARAGARQAQINELAQTLRTSFGELELISPGQLDATMRAAYTALAPEEVEQALAEAQVTRTTPLELPKSSGLQETTYRALKSHLIDAQVGSVPELLHGQLASIRVLEGFVCRPPQPNGLTEAAIRQAIERENKRPASESQAARAALGILNTAVKGGADLRQLSIFHLLDNVRQHNAQGAPPGALVKQLVAARLEQDEARMAVFSVRNESAPAAQAAGLGPVKELLARGHLIAATQALAALTNADDAAVARELVERQVAEVRALRDTALAALRIGDEEFAADRLRQAGALAADDADIAAQLSRIPPPPVLGVSAQPEGVGVRVSWRPAPSHEEGTRYRLVRKTDRVPADPADGVLVREDSATVTVDPAAPAGQLVGYAVFAATDEGPWSRPAGVSIEVLPPVHDVRLTAERGIVQGRWQVHPDVFSVEVRRGGSDGVLLPRSGKTEFHDRVDTEAEPAERVYTLVACYRRTDGSEARSTAVQARTTNRGRLQPVSGLHLSAVSGENGPRVAIRWRQARDAEVTVRRASRPCGWEFGEVVPLAELASYGEEVRGRSESDGEWRTLISDVPTGLFHYVPFTLGPSGAVRGFDNSLGIALPMTGLRHQRLGEELVLSWVWPEQVGTAEIRWRGSGDSSRVRLTRQQYQTAGGFRIRCGTGEVNVRVRSVLFAEGGECFSADAELTVPERPPSVRYTVELTRRPLLGTTARVRLTADQSVPRCTVLVVAAQGVVMPNRPTDGQLVLRSDQELQAGQEVELSAELPRLRRPYWVRCFLDDDAHRNAAHLVDPPTTQLKVK